MDEVEHKVKSFPLRLHQLKGLFVICFLARGLFFSLLLLGLPLRLSLGVIGQNYFIMFYYSIAEVNGFYLHFLDSPEEKLPC